MHKLKHYLSRLVIGFLILFLVGWGVVFAQKVPPPEEILGFKVGTDYHLATYEQALEYFRALEAASSRVKLLVDSEGNILVHTVREDTGGSPPKFDAFDPEGKFIGTVNITGLKAFPRGALLGKDCVWIIERDEEDQVQVVKYRIAPGK